VFLSEEASSVTQSATSEDLNSAAATAVTDSNRQGFTSMAIAPTVAAPAINVAGWVAANRASAGCANRAAALAGWRCHQRRPS